MSDFCANFFPDIQGGDSGCVKNTISGTGSCDDPLIITPSFDISAQNGNSVVCNADGIYAAAETLCYRISYTQSGELCVTETGCETYEFVKAGSVISLESTYVSIPPAGGSVVAELVDNNGTVYATATTAAGSQGASWNNSTITISADTFLGLRISSVGATYPGCSYSTSFLACEPLSLFAPTTTTGAGITTIDVSTGNCLSGSTSGSGTPLDPVVISLAQKIDPDATNALECRTGGLYVSSTATPLLAPSLQAGDVITSNITTRHAKEKGSALSIDDNEISLRISADNSNERLSFDESGALTAGAEHHSVSGMNDNLIPLYSDGVMSVAESFVAVSNPSSVRHMNLHVHASLRHVANHSTAGFKIEMRDSVSDEWKVIANIKPNSYITNLSWVTNIPRNAAVAYSFRAVVKEDFEGEIFVPALSYIGMTE